MTQVRTTFNLNGAEVPALITSRGIGGSVVINLHGLDVSKEVNITDMGRLESAGLWSVTIDAPHHGERSDGYLDIMRNANRREAYLMLLSIINQEAAEVANLVNFYKSQGKKVAVSGISMGAYATYALMMINRQPDLFVTFMGNPDFRYKGSSVYTYLEKSGPIDDIENIFPANLFIVNAGSDDIVDPDGARRFYNAIKPYYKDSPEKLEYREYPESGHLMRPEDWFDAWDALIARLKREGF